MQLSPLSEKFQLEDQSWLASTHGIDAGRSVTLKVSSFSADLYDNGYIPSGVGLIALSGGDAGLYGQFAGGLTDEVQTVTISGSPTGGTFTLTFDGDTTAAIAHNAAAADVQAALEALGTIGAGNVTVSGSGPYTVKFVNDLGERNVDAMTATGSFTGGTTPSVAVATTTAGGSDVTGSTNLAGILYTSLSVVSRNGQVADQVSGVMLPHCLVIADKLPVPIDAAGQATAAGRIIFL